MKPIPGLHRFARQCLVLLLALAAFSTQAEEAKHKPYVLASQQAGELSAVVDSTRAALQAAGFEIAGEIAPYNNAHLLVITNDALKKNAAASEHGGFGAMQRVSVTKVDDQVQVAFTNPVYMSHAYRMQGDLAEVRKALAGALGAKQDFGSAKGLTTEKLRKYHYMIFRPYFDEPNTLGEFKTYAQAVAAVEKGLADKRAGISKVYSIEIPGKQETLFGVHMTRECSGDDYIMSRIDFDKVKSTPHLPYEILVSGNKVFALKADFRIAISFPDLSMMGSNSFMSIMCAPDSIADAQKEMVTGKKKEEF